LICSLIVLYPIQRERIENKYSALFMAAPETQGNLMKVFKNLEAHRFTSIASGFSLSRPWRILARLGLLFTQIVAMTTTFAPERRPDAPARRQQPRFSMNKEGYEYSC
jgi:hypothetical protein